MEKHDLEVLTKSRAKAATPLTFQYAEPSCVARTPFVGRVACLKPGRLLSSQKDFNSPSGTVPDGEVKPFGDRKSVTQTGYTHPAKKRSC